MAVWSVMALRVVPLTLAPLLDRVELGFVEGTVARRTWVACPDVPPLLLYCAEREGAHNHEWLVCSDSGHVGGGGISLSDRSNIITNILPFDIRLSYFLHNI